MFVGHFAGATCAPMRRICVVGCSGAGKSRLARELGRRLGLPVIHMDAHYHRPGWVDPPAAEWEAMQPALFAGDAWVADGNFHAMLSHRTARADTIVFLDLPRVTCLRGALGRLLRRWGEAHDDMAPGCREGFDASLLRWIWNWHRDVRPATVGILRAFEESGGRVIALRSRSDVDAFVRSIGGARPAVP